MKIIIRIFSVLIVIAVIFSGWLGMTNSGLRWSFHYAKAYLPAELKLNSIEGHLFGIMRLKGIEYKQDDVLFTAKEIILNWSPSALLVSTMSVSKLQIESLNIELPESQKSAARADDHHPISLPEIYLPWRVSLNNAVINGLTLQQDSDIFIVDTINLNASTLFNKLDINKLSIQAGTFNLTVKGNIQLAKNYQHQLDMRWQTKLSSGEMIKGKGTLAGDIKKTTLEQALIQPIQTTLHADVLNLLSQPQWHAQLNIPEFEATKLSPTAPGVLAQLSVQANGDLTTASLDGSIHAKHVSLERPIDAHFKLQIKKQDKGITISKLELADKDTQLNLHGEIAEQLKLNWTLSIKELDRLYPQVKGNLQAGGVITGTVDSPIINATYSGHTVGLTEYEMGSFTGSLNVDLFHWQQLKLKLLAKNIKLKDYLVQALNIHADNQQLTLHAVSETATANIVLKGRADANGWQGKIQQADIQSKQFSNWKLKSPVSLNVTTSAVMFQALCWVNSTDASICASLQNQKQLWQSKVILRKFPLSLMNSFLSTDIIFDGKTDATAEIQFQTPTRIIGHAQVILLPGSIFYPVPDGEHEQWKYQGGTINLTLNQQGLKTESEFTLNKSDKLTIKAALPNLQLLSVNPQQQNIQAEVALYVQELGFLEALIPEVQDLNGEMGVKLILAGTLAKPQINATASLPGGSLRIPRLGLTVSKLKLNGRTDNSGYFNFYLDGHSGDGDIALAGRTRLDSSSGWPTEMTLKGEQFEVSRIPEARVVVSPDLTIKLQHKTIDVRGKLHIPYAKLQPKDITTAARVSQDATIIGQQKIAESPWSIVTKVRITFGERVNFYGYGFEGRLGGSLLLEDAPGELTTATGEINIPEGKYQAYGQNLTVQHGRLIYTGGPVTNPGLDIRAVRIVNNITAGLKVTGSLTQPQIELFSIPAMGQTNILSYLLMGAPIETASKEDGSMMAKAALALGLSGGDNLARKLGDQFGLDQMRVESSDTGDQASLVMGRYLSPKLYVSYGVGLIESFNTFTVRYQLSDKWQIKAQSGEAQGADILYTIER